MGILLTALALVTAVQDPESRYREALYLEVDKGDLDKALELYRTVQADATAPEAVRARSAFRSAWCLEKKGQKVDAQGAYRDVLARFAGQPEITQKARERIDRLASGESPAARSVTQEERIGEQILALGSTKQETRDDAWRTLVLIGKPAIPALRQALSHKDAILSVMAACALVEMDEDEGVCSALMRGVREGTTAQYPSFLNKLLKRQPECLKEFMEAFRKEERRGYLDRYVRVLTWSAIPETRERLHELLLRGPKDLISSVLYALNISQEAELLDLLSKLVQSEESAERAQMLLEHSSVKVTVTDTRAFARQIAALFPTIKGWDPIRGTEKFVPADTILHECAGSWLRDPNEGVHFFAHNQIQKLGLNRFGVVIHLLDEKLSDMNRYRLLWSLYDDPHPVGDQVKAVVERALWAAFDREKGPFQDAAAEALLSLAAETHPRWEELIRLKLSEQLPQERKVYPPPFMRIQVVDPVCSIPSRFPKFGREGQKRIQAMIYSKVKSEDEEEAIRAIELTSLIGGDLKRRVERLSEVAQDEKAGERARLAAIEGIDVRPHPNSIPDTTLPSAPAVLSLLLKDKNAKIRQQAAQVLTGWRCPETDRSLAGLVQDPEVDIIAISYFLEGLEAPESKEKPRESYFEPLVNALKSPKPKVREKAAAGLAWMESIKAVPYLIPFLDDESADVRAHVRIALDAIKKRYEERAQWQEWYERVKPKDK
jgi:hypothetical protein